MTPGTRIRVVGGPWTHRIGCEGVVVAPPQCGTYPQPSPGEVLVLLDDDPLIKPAPLTGGGEWTCVIRRSAVKSLGGAA